MYRFKTEQNYPRCPIQKENQSGGTRSPKRGPFPLKKTDRLPDLRVLSEHWSDFVENYTDLITLALRSDDIQECDSTWDGISSMTKIPSDDISDSLHNSRIRESENLKTVLELCDLETQKKAGLDNHKLKTMVKRSIEQNLQIKNFETRKRKL